MEKKNKKKKVLLLLFRGPWIIPLGYSAVVYITFDTRSVAKKERKKKNLTIIMPVRKIYLHLCVFGSRRYYEEAVLIFVFRLFLIHLCLCVWVFSADKKREPTFTWVTDGCSSLNGSLSQDQNPCPVGLLLLDNTICKSIISISILFLFKWRTKIYRFYKAFSIYENVKIGSVFIRNEFV